MAYYHHGILIPDNFVALKFDSYFTTKSERTEIEFCSYVAYDYSYSKLSLYHLIDEN